MQVSEPLLMWARRRFERSKFYRVYRLDFDEVHGLFNGILSFKKIGALLKQSADMVGFMYWSYFYQICPDRTVIAAKRKAEQRAQLLASIEGRVPHDSLLAYVLRTARGAGCDALVIPRTEHRGMRAPALGRVGINGRFCTVQSAHGKYGAVSISRTMVESVHAHIVARWNDSEKTDATVYVIPSHTVRKMYFDEFPERNVATLYAQSGERCPKGGLCTRAYVQAWWVVGKL